MIDTHTHLNFKAFENDWREVVERAIDAGVEKMIVVGTDIESSKRAVEMSENHEALYASIGVHPHHTRGIRNKETRIKFIKEQLMKLLKQPKVVAIGEVGLDYHQYKNSKYPLASLKINNKIKELQKQLLIMQVKLAQQFNKPLILHSREAGKEVLDLVIEISQKIKWQAKGVFHCFEGNKKYLKNILEAGFFVSFTGNTTYSKDRAMVSKQVPLNRLLLETDSPLIAPMPFRGKRNEPRNVKIIASKHAQMRLIHLNEVRSQTTENARFLFQI